MANKEIEIQLRIEKIEPLENYLKEKGRFVATELQKDEYFTPAHRDFTKVRPVREWLRIRQEKNKTSLCYKYWYYDGQGRSNHCDEYEFGISDAEKARLMFSALNFSPLATVNKRRCSYHYQDYEVSLDEIEGLGNFVEIEYKGKDESNPHRIIGEMIAWLKTVGVGKIERNYVGYPFQLMFPKEVTFEAM